MDKESFATERADVIGGGRHALVAELTCDLAHCRNDALLDLAGLDVVQDQLLAFR
jgi:hypothetical protein